jgi:hypothetical protein
VWSERIEKFFNCRPGKNEDIFSFTRLEESKKNVEDMQHLAAEVGQELIIPQFLVM